MLSNLFFVIGYFLQRAHWLSLDVVAGAMLIHSLANRLPDGHGDSSWATTILVGLSVFMIYAFDRFLDNQKTSQITSTRHRFYAQHRVVLSKTLLGCAALGFVFLFWLPFKVIVFGGVLIVVIGLYLWFIFKSSPKNSLQSFKEPFVAICYTVGIWLPSLLTQEIVPWESYALMVLFGLLAFQNLLLFSWFESFDLEEGYTMATAWGTETVAQVMNVLSFLIVIGGLIVAFCTAYHFSTRAALVVALMSLAKQIIRKQAPKLLPNDQYRWLGDGVFLLAVWVV